MLCVSVVIDANIANGRDIRNLDSNIKSLRQKLTRHQAPQGGVQVFLGNADKRIAAQSGQQPRSYRLGTPGFTIMPLSMVCTDSTVSVRSLP